MKTLKHAMIIALMLSASAFASTPKCDKDLPARPVGSFTDNNNKQKVANQYVAQFQGHRAQVPQTPQNSRTTN